MSNEFTTIDWIKETQRERDRLKDLRKLQGYAYYKCKGLDTILDNLLIVAVAMLIAMVNTVIIKLEHWLVAVKNCTGDDCPQLQWLIYIALGTLYAYISANIVYYISSLAAGSGIPQVKTILGGFIIKKFLGFRTLVAKLLGLALSDASSLCLGKEGPLVHLACCVANICCRFVPKYSGNAAKRREIFSAACAAGVAVAFGSPIGGVLFSLEEVSYYFPFNTMAKSFYMATLASLTIHLLNPYGTNKLVMFQVDIPRNWELFELPIFCLLGVIGGIYGSLFIKFNIKLQKWRKNTPLIAAHPIVEVVLLAFLSALLSYPVLYSRVSLAELVTNLFRDCDAVDPAFSEMCLGDGLRVAMGLMYTIFLVSLLTTVTFGINVPAGLFVPTMAVGASTGRLLGLIFQTVIYNNPFILPGCYTVKNCITPGHFAIVGAAAFLGGVTRMTVYYIYLAIISCDHVRTNWSCILHLADYDNCGNCQMGS